MRREDAPVDRDGTGDRLPLLVRALAGSRWVIAVAVVGSLISSMLLLLYGAAAAIEHVREVLVNRDVSGAGAKHLAVSLVQITDVFLLGTVELIVAFGLCELFLYPDLPVPPWLHIRDLDELKGKIIGVIVVLLAVTFLGFVVEWDGSARILELGAAIALVIGGLAAFLMFTGKSVGGEKG